MPGPPWQPNTATSSLELKRPLASAIAQPTRSCRTTMGRMSAAAANSVSGEQRMRQQFQELVNYTNTSWGVADQRQF